MPSLVPPDEKGVRCAPDRPRGGVLGAPRKRERGGGACSGLFPHAARWLREVERLGLLSTLAVGVSFHDRLGSFGRSIRQPVQVRASIQVSQPVK